MLHKSAQPQNGVARGTLLSIFMNALVFVTITVALQIPAFAALTDAQSPSPIIVPDKVKLQAEAFDLADVRLLDSPFKTAMELNARYLLSLSSDRFLSLFRREAGLTPKAPNYGGWESPDSGAGRCLGHYLSAMSLQYRATGDARFKSRIDYIVDELATCQAAYGNGYVGALPQAREVFARLADNDGRALYKSRVPWYIIHKLMAGLRDAYLLGGNVKARTVLIRFCDWAIATTQGVDDTQFQIMLDQEHGGMREVLADVYAITGDPKYLALANRFAHQKVLEPLAWKEDKLAGLHANTQIPKIVGSARVYELTGVDREAGIAGYFWDEVVSHHTYAIGGDSSDEHFEAPDKLSLTVTTAETCNTYNMLKLTRHLFEWNPQVKYADYYERALYNDILASQEPGTGMFTYYIALLSGHYRVYSTPADSFWCCVGTGMENHTQYGNSIYFHGENELFVNLFIPSVLDWKAKNIILRQETTYPKSDVVTFKIQAKDPVSLSLKLRYPAWAKPGMTASINGEPFKLSGQPGSYATIQRVWNDGDRLKVRIPFGLRTETMPGDTNKISIFYGPIVLGGRLGEVADLKLRYANLRAEDHFSDVPALIDNGQPVDDWVKPVNGRPLTFQTVGVGQPHDVTLLPFYQLAHDRYAVYWDLLKGERFSSGSSTGSKTGILSMLDPVRSGPNN
ncbi:MAG: beta-L-arabinofuranosidase domain-containing protein [Verrucomicrobiota bacterium]